MENLKGKKFDYAAPSTWFYGREYLGYGSQSGCLAGSDREERDGADHLMSKMRACHQCRSSTRQQVCQMDYMRSCSKAKCHIWMVVLVLFLSISAVDAVPLKDISQSEEVKAQIF